MSSKKGLGLILLRSVNLLRRKIVRSEHSKLAGLALLLLSKIFPACERSGKLFLCLNFITKQLGVNLRGERNIENKNLKNFCQIRDRSYDFVCHLHKLFYISPSDVLKIENWTILCQVLTKKIILN